MAAGGARRAALVAVLVVTVSGYHAHRPLHSLQYMHPDGEGRPAISQDDHGNEAPESKAREQRESVPVRPRRYVGDGHIGVKIDQGAFSGAYSFRSSLIVCEQLVLLRHTSQAGQTVSCTFSGRLKTPEARAQQVARWGRGAEVAVQFVSVDVFMNVVQECLRLEESPKPPPPDWSILSLLQIRSPGTLWCGNGQTAEDLAELGAWGPVDHCCRLHDLCPVQLPPYVRYRGAINITPKPLSHCTCDVRFASCLYKVNNRRASFIFHTYFNVLFRRGFCATIQPRERRMGFTRGFTRFWTHLIDSFDLMSDPDEEETIRKRRKVITSPSRELTSVSTNTTHVASPLSTMELTPSSTQPPQTMTLGSSPSPSPFPSPCSASFPSSF
ncbi:uncharacterized protein LOC127001910 [Eriocheir sinensis]|uniref:uncharacterized protein LOC127001910 n=1 Tax=Eriocheir sinensis TaxID=95602 RepID=UPI0021C910B2|nr:uncharacterized protein LOC127001910 [Eriocheir sinensis]